MKIIARLFLFVLIISGCSVKTHKLSFKPITTDTASKRDLDIFSQTLVHKIIYRQIPRENLAYGKLTALFAINKYRKVKYVQILKSPHDILSTEVVNALKDIKYPPVIKPGKPYALQINFIIEFLARQSTTTHHIPAPDSTVHIKLPPALSKESTITYNPGKIKIPAKAIQLDEITKPGYILVFKDETVY